MAISWEPTLIDDLLPAGDPREFEADSGEAIIDQISDPHPDDVRTIEGISVTVAKEPGTGTVSTDASHATGGFMSWLEGIFGRLTPLKIGALIVAAFVVTAGARS